MSDTVNNVRMGEDWDNIKNGWMAFALENGASNGTVYDSRSDAIRYHRNKASKYFYLTLRQCMHGISPKEATLALAMCRVQLLRGRYHPENSLSDPISPITREDYYNELLSTKLNKPMVIPNLGEYIDSLRS